MISLRRPVIATLIAAVMLCVPVGAGAVTPKTPFAVGVNAHTQVAGVKMMVAMGATWIRGDAHWSDIETTRGTYDFARTDAFISNATSLGLKVYLNLSGTPAWASASGRYQAVPSDTKAWPAFVRAMALRYGSRVAAWGVWSEPNISQFWDGSAADYYRAILRPAHTAINAVSKKYIVAGPDVAMTPTIDPRPFLAALRKPVRQHRGIVVGATASESGDPLRALTHL